MNFQWKQNSRVTDDTDLLGLNASTGLNMIKTCGSEGHLISYVIFYYFVLSWNVFSGSVTKVCFQLEKLHLYKKHSQNEMTQNSVIQRICTHNNFNYQVEIYFKIFTAVMMYPRRNWHRWKSHSSEWLTSLYCKSFSIKI